MLHELLPILLVVSTTLTVAGLQATRFSQVESRWIMMSYGAHVISSFIQVWFTVSTYGSGDMVGYTYMGETLAAAMRLDPVQFVPEVFKLLIHQPAMLPVDVIGAGSSTGSMSALAGFLTFATGGSLYTISCCVAIAAHFGQVALYKAFRSALPDAPVKHLLFAALLVPSEVFWSSGLIKEGVALFGLGYAVYGIEKTLRGERLAALPSLFLGIMVIGLFKPYIVVAITGATTAAFLFNSPNRSEAMSRPVNIAGAALIGVFGTAAILRLFPNYNPDAIAEQAAYLQEMGQVVAGRSTYSIGDSTKKSFAGQIVFAPIALVTSLFRPLIVEVKNPQMFVNALETTTILVLTVRLFNRRGVGGVWSAVTARPILVFFLVFTVLFGVGVGLTTTNMGTLSRYRMPLVPFLWCFVLVLSAKPVAVEMARAAAAVLRPLPRHRAQIARANSSAPAQR